MIKEPIPEVDMRMVAKNSEAHRRGIFGFAPRIGMVSVDYDDLDRIDNFYLETQRYRDYYRDPHNTLHKPPRFRQHQGKCGIKLDTSVQHFSRPIRWVKEGQPVLYPYSKDTAMMVGIPISSMITGHYAKSTCVSFLR
ncbi:uncharacterized protein LOC26526555 [Drosophila erecta]|uniref:Uncharacterized protein n=1 Tax=Drosophila erecta TaxID=7220 RepID=A0A0Q5WIX9_DROER|nr:uncharacterized protein LOC26526555 [Drosophila erecta]KQS70347.1 uncharacterized protein Dere_GG26731 [Drosophila erecta]